MVNNPEAKLPAGSRLGHFEINELIGAGGMGVVFRARDVRLGRPVALKVLSHDLFDDERARRRFLREAQLASTLSHPNVATVYEIDEKDGVTFIAMELVRGKDLKRFLAVSGRLSIEDAVSVGAQVCEALAAAHEAGIVHRDVKSSNIMLSPEGKVKVLDFGLAKGLDASRDSDAFGSDTPTRESDLPKLLDPSEDSDLRHTKPGILVGTPSYMSPEQASGRAVDARSDIFSLGVVLYEAVSGELPFRGHSEGEILEAVRSFEPTPLHVSRRGIPSRFSRTVSKCLAKNPSDRFQSATELLEALKRTTRRNLSTSLVARVAARAPGRRSWLAALSACVLLLAWLFHVADRPPPVSFQERDWILIGDFKSFAEDPRLGDALGAAFRVGLEQSSYLRVYPQADVAAALKRMRRDSGESIQRELGAEICQREGIRALVLGQVVQIGRSFKLSAQVVEPGSQRTVLVESTTVQGTEALVGGIESLAEAVRKKLGESLATLARVSQPLERVTSHSLEALYAFSQGMKEMASANDAEAIKFFERALELDPEFAMAHARAGLVYYTSGTSRAAALEHWRKALEYVDRLTEYEKLYVRASEARLTDPPEALRLWSMMRTLYPTSVVGHHNAAVSRWHLHNDFARAADGFAAAAATGAPRSFVSLEAQGYMELGLGRFGAALEHFQEARRRGDHPLTSGLADALIAMTRYDDALEVLYEAERSPIRLSAMEARARRAALHLDRGQISEARRLYEDTLVHSSGSSATRWTAASRLSLHACDEIEGETSLLSERLRQDIVGSLESLESPEEHGYSALLRLGLLTKIWLRNFGVRGSEAALDALGEVAARLSFDPGEAYAAMLRAETGLVGGDAARAEEEIKRAMAVVDLFQLHETLARVYRAQGKLEEALGEYHWILEHRGQVFAESSGEWSARELSLLDWARAHFHAAELEEELGRVENARTLYEAFLDHWSLADSNLAEIREARRRQK